MTRVKTESEVEVYEVEGQPERSPLNNPRLKVRTHWNDCRKVKLKIDGAPEIVVLASDLELAIKRASA